MQRPQKAKARLPEPRHRALPEPNKNLHTILLLCLLLLVTGIAFHSVLKNGFTNWDDHGYVVENPLVKDLSAANLKIIFTNQVMGNYHPFTILSLALDYRLFGMNAPGFHAMSLLFHLLSVALLFLFLLKLTGNTWPAVIAALLFAIHPMHVESVAWISERKDVGYVFFYLVALLLYLHYLEATRKRYVFYGLVMCSFLISLLFKGQAVTLPLVLLLIDYFKGRNLRETWRDKIPLFLVALAFGVVAILAQKESDSIQDIKLYSYWERILFAGNALAGYLWKSVVPAKLSAFYPYPDKTGAAYDWYIYVIPVLIAGLGIVAFLAMKKSKDFAFGCLFFLVNIGLVLQLLPVGNAIMADRYSYLAFTGIFFVAGQYFQKYFLAETAPLKKFKAAGILALGIYFIFLVNATVARTRVWHDSGKLFTDVIQKYPNVPIAYNNLGSYYQKQDRLPEAKANFDQAIRIQPDFPDALVNRSDVFRVWGQVDSSVHDCTHAIRINPKVSGAWMNRGIAYAILNKPDSAMRDFNRVLSLDPSSAKAYGNRGNLFDIQGKTDSALADYNHALALDPSYQDVYGNRARSYIKKGRLDDAITDLNTAIRLSPYNAEHYFFLALAYQEKKDWKKAYENAMTSKSLGKEINPDALEYLRSKSGLASP